MTESARGIFTTLPNTNCDNYLRGRTVMKRLNLLLAVAALFLIAGCSDDDTTTTTVSTTGASGDAVSIDGSWDFGCDSDPDWAASQSTDTFSGSSFTGTEKFYITDATCSDSDFYTLTTTATYSVEGEETAATFGSSTVTATQVTFVISSFTVTPDNAAAADAMNSVEDFGLSNWAAGTSQDVTTEIVSFLGSDTLNFLIYIDDTADPDRMYWDDSDSVFTSGFPTAISTTDFSERQ